MNVNICPCEECLKFPICKYKRAVMCKDMFVYMHTFSRPGYTDVYLDAGKQNMKSTVRVEYLFEKNEISWKHVAKDKDWEKQRNNPRYLLLEKRFGDE